MVHCANWRSRSGAGKKEPLRLALTVAPYRA